MIIYTNFIAMQFYYFSISLCLFYHLKMQVRSCYTYTQNFLVVLHCMQSASWWLCSDPEGLTWAHFLVLPDLSSFLSSPHLTFLRTRGHVSFLVAFAIPPSRRMGLEYLQGSFLPLLSAFPQMRLSQQLNLKWKAPSQLFNHLLCSFFHISSLGVLKNVFIHYFSLCSQM